MQALLANFDSCTSSLLRNPMHPVNRPSESHADQAIPESLEAKKPYKSVKQSDNGFVAGTLVHTRDGLKPIEQIKVGDWVLSRPENSDSRIEQKQILRTFSFEDKEVFELSYYREGDVEFDTLVGTPNHPFWVPGIHPHLLSQLESSGRTNPWADKSGWIPVDWLEGPQVLSRLDGGVASLLIEPRPIYVTPDAEHGFIFSSRRADDGHLIDFRDGGVRYQHGDTVSVLLVDPLDLQVRYRATVYNLEVDEFHTYFVGEEGVWVHD
jgi:hypothetical protein